MKYCFGPQPGSVVSMFQRCKVAKKIENPVLQIIQMNMYCTHKSTGEKMGIN